MSLFTKARLAAVLLATTSLLGACAGEVPCQDAICVQEKMIRAQSSAALLNAGAGMLSASQPQYINVYRW